MAPSKQHWICPDCKRSFTTRRQWHSCMVRTVNDHFRGKPKEVKEIYDALLRVVSKFGPVKTSAVKTAINFTAKKSHFIMAYVQQSGIKIDFGLRNKVIVKRIDRVEKYSPGVYIHYVKLTKPEDVDAQLIKWLRQSYAISS